MQGKQAILAQPSSRPGLRSTESPVIIRSLRGPLPVYSTAGPLSFCRSSRMPQLGLLADQPWWVPVLYIVVMGHITNLCVTLYLHRSATHEGVVFHPVITHFMRAWLWLTTGINTKEWVACHRKHHAFSDRQGDPHSPVQEGLLEIVFGGVFFYQEAVNDKAMLEKYGRGCLDDAVERHLYARRTMLGIVAMFVVDMLLFGPLWGMVTWASM